MDREFQAITPAIEPQDPDCVPLTPVNPAIFEEHTPLTVTQIGVEAYKGDIVRMYEHYKQYKREHRTNCKDEYCKTHYTRYVNWNRYLNPNATTCSVCGTCAHQRMTCNAEDLILEMEI